MRNYKIYIDENLPPSIAHGLNLFQKYLNDDNTNIQVLSIKEVFGQGAKDEDWIPVVGKEKGIVITQDNRIQTLKHQKELYKSSGVGIFFMSPPSKSGYLYWEMVKQLINRWENILHIVRHNKTPFSYRWKPKSGIEELI